MDFKSRECVILRGLLRKIVDSSLSMKDFLGKLKPKEIDCYMNVTIEKKYPKTQPRRTSCSNFATVSAPSHANNLAVKASLMNYETAILAKLWHVIDDNMLLLDFNTACMQ